MKLPEPVIIGMEEVDFNTFEPRKGYTESQMRQAIRDALEEAAKVCDEHLEYPSLTPRHCADAIRKLKEDV